MPMSEMSLVGSVDPLGLADCSFNIQIQNSGLLSPSDLSRAQAEINNRILATAGLGVNFVSNEADFTAQLKNNPTTMPGALIGVDFDLFGRNNASFGPPSNSSSIWVNNIEMGTPGTNLGIAVGRVITHEFAHWGLQAVHDHLSPGPLEVGILTPGHDSTLLNGLATFLPIQSKKLSKTCADKHPSSQGTGGVGGSGGGAVGTDIYAQYWFAIMMGYYGVPVVTTSFDPNCTGCPALP